MELFAWLLPALGLLSTVVLLVICVRSDKRNSKARILNEHQNESSSMKIKKNANNQQLRRLKHKNDSGQQSSKSSSLLSIGASSSSQLREKQRGIEKRQRPSVKLDKEKLAELKFEQTSKDDTLENVESLPTEKSTAIDVAS
ncbi:hypothetical protein Tcan_12660 [Toxocara canis]|uniref:Uncharacterized protein n=1 Tax=Toxocara canis TaxID=6265 RepID=A0A0B2VBH8_TOXCA|nr:hypothetical protein Tcan_12660 [Toxocara canis]